MASVTDNTKTIQQALTILESTYNILSDNKKKKCVIIDGNNNIFIKSSNTMFSRAVCSLTGLNIRSLDIIDKKYILVEARVTGTITSGDFASNTLRDATSGSLYLAI